MILQRVQCPVRTSGAAPVATAARAATNPHPLTLSLLMNLLIIDLDESVYLLNGKN